MQLALVPDDGTEQSPDEQARQEFPLAHLSCLPTLFCQPGDFPERHHES